MENWVNFTGCGCNQIQDNQNTKIKKIQKIQIQNTNYNCGMWRSGSSGWIVGGNQDNENNLAGANFLFRSFRFYILELGRS